MSIGLHLECSFVIWVDEAMRTSEIDCILLESIVIVLLF